MKTNFYIEPPTGLLEKCIKRIHKEERILVIKKLSMFSLMFLASLAGFLPSLKMLLSDFASSGFLNFFSLIFSDFSSVAKYWQSFMMLLLQTLPAISLAVFLAVVLLFLQSLRSITKEVKTIIKLASI